MASLKFYAFVKVFLILVVAAIQLFFINKFLSNKTNVIPNSFSSNKDTFSF